MLPRIWETGMGKPEDMTPFEQARFRVLMYSTVHAFETLHYQLKQFGFESTFWNRQLPMIARVIGSPGGGRWWQEHNSEFYEEFVRDVTAALGKPTA